MMMCSGFQWHLIGSVLFKGWAYVTLLLSIGPITSYAQISGLKTEENPLFPEKAIFALTIPNSVNTGGTAFLLKNNLIVTNYHVMSILQENPAFIKEQALQLWTVTGDSYIVRINLIRVSALYDIALLKINKILPFTGLNVVKNFSLSARDLRVAGFPIENGRQFLKFWQAGPVFAYDPYFFRFFVNFSSRLGGVSGGPVLNSQNQVVGVYHSTIANFVQITKANILRDIITGHKGFSCGLFRFEYCMDQAIKKLYKEANLGSKVAQYRLGIMYNRGIIAPADSEKAIFYFRKSAEQGHAPSQHELAELIVNSRVSLLSTPIASRISALPISTKKALAWYQLASQQSFIPSKIALVTMYLMGAGMDNIPIEIKVQNACSVFIDLVDSVGNKSSIHNFCRFYSKQYQKLCTLLFNHC